MTEIARNMLFEPGAPLRGTVQVPGDKSISHRSLMLSALSVGESRVSGLLEGEDVLATAAAMRALGAQIHRSDDGLLMGLLASHDLTATFVGDASLSKRPMGRVTTPLGLMGAEFMTSPGGRLPLTMRGLVPAVPIEYRLPVASAQVKSAILLAGLNTPGITRVIEPVPTRDHSERMLRGFGAQLTVETQADGTRIISLTGEAELKPQTLVVPGDPSSAAFPVVAALITPGSDVTVTNVGMNPTRTGLFRLLRAMGADLTIINEREVGGEPVADLVARHSALTGIDVPPDIAPSMIDEFPVFFVAAAHASGTTRTSGLDELRVKESDRLALMAQGLARIGASVEGKEDGLIIAGRGGDPLSGSNGTPNIAAELDHRIAMSFAVAGLATRGGLIIDDMSPVATSFPGFTAMLDRLRDAAA